MNNSKIQIANAPCSWGVLEFELEGKALGYQQVLNEIAETGYTGTELGDWGFMPTVPKELHEQLALRKLNLLGAFVPVALADETAHEAGIQLALKTAGLMHDAGYANAFIVLADNNGTIDFRTNNAGRIEPKHSLNSNQMKTFAEGANKIAKAVKDKYGMRLVFHHHCAGYIETPAEIESFLSLTDPELVGLCFDTGHYQFGGGNDPVRFMNKHWDRIWHIHFKDFSWKIALEAASKSWNYFESVSNGVFCELGKGIVDFNAINKFLKDKNYNSWIVVEQDVLPGMGEPAKCAAKNREYLRQIGL